MKQILNAIKRNTGLTHSESTLVLGVSVILLLGWVGRSTLDQPETHNVEHATRVIELLDSLNRQVRSAQPSPSDTADQPVGPATEATGANGTTYRHAASTSARTAASTVTHRVNINTATETQLVALPGVGPATARAILAERGRRTFASAEDLTRVRGIGPKKLEKMRPYIIVP